MLQLSELPDGVLTTILSFLSTEKQSSLALVCQKLNKVLVRFRYREIRLTDAKSKRSIRKMTLLLRTLLERPRIGAYIIKLKVSGDYEFWAEQDSSLRNAVLPRSNWAWGLSGSSPLSRSHIVPASKLLRRYVDADLDQSQDGLWQRCRDIIASTILTLCRNLETLEIGDGFLTYSRLLPDILRKVDRLHPKLERVVLGNRQMAGRKAIPYVDLNLITPIFQSSSVRSFECTMAEPWQFSWRSTQAPRCLNLTTLRLVRTNITRSTLIHLLSATPNLRVFQYEQVIIYDETSVEMPALSPYLDLEELNTALRCVRHTLVELQLILRLAAGYIPASECATSGIPFPTIQGKLNLREMPRLKIVEVPLVMVFGWFPRLSSPLQDVVPPSVQDLTLRDDLIPYCPWSLRHSSCERRIERVGRFIQGRKDVAPNLVSMNLRLTVAKVILRPIVQELRDVAVNTHMKLIKGAKSETYTWQFQQAKDGNNRPRLADRIDSVMDASPGTEFFANAVHVSKPSNAPTIEEQKINSNFVAPHRYITCLLYNSTYADRSSMFSSIRPLKIR